MQPTPIRLSQTIWTAFRAAKPVHRPAFYQQLQCPAPTPRPSLRSKQTWTKPPTSCVRFYSEGKLNQDIEKKVEDAKDRIQGSLDSRAQAVADGESTLKSKEEETIVHTLPESSSIVYSRDSPSSSGQQQQQDETTKHTPASQSAIPGTPTSDLPSQIAAFRSNLTHRFSHFMDKFQSQIFVASRQINDLTGYTGIERLKRDIETQESLVQAARQQVKSTRNMYSEAIAMRSATQREVNDLLHRKHAWSAQDLERFTGLYRSDHANEQAEQKAHQGLSEAEVRYEEASTKLAKSILARYHEEQIWSDKIRQMSTWGTWGLMGLNLLLFVVLQLAIEPWRRKRLVRGFEDKVEAALSAREQENAELRAHLRARDGDVVVQDAVQTKTEGAVVVAGEQLAEAVVDAITGATSADDSDTTEKNNIASDNEAVVKTEDIESAAEQVTSQELEKESTVMASDILTQITDSTPPEGGTPDIIPDIDVSSGGVSTPTSPLSSSPGSREQQQPNPFSLPSSMLSAYTSLKQLSDKYTTKFLSQFDETDHVVLTQREITTKILEGVAFGVTACVAVLFVFSGRS